MLYEYTMMAMMIPTRTFARERNNGQKYINMTVLFSIGIERCLLVYAFITYTAFAISLHFLISFSFFWGYFRHPKTFFRHLFHYVLYNHENCRYRTCVCDLINERVWIFEADQSSHSDITPLATIRIGIKPKSPLQSLVDHGPHWRNR